MTAALEGGEWSAARPGRTLPPGKTRYPFYRRLGGPQGYIYMYLYIYIKWSRYSPVVAQRVGRGIALLLHDRGTRRGWVVSSTPRPHITPGKDPVPILQEAGWAPGIYLFIYLYKVKWYRYRPGVAQRVGRGIALLFHDRGTRRGWVVISTLRPHFTPGKNYLMYFMEIIALDPANHSKHTDMLCAQCYSTSHWMSGTEQ